MQVKAGQAIQAASQSAKALHATLVAASAEPPGDKRVKSSSGHSQGQVLAAICDEFQASTGLATELRSQAGDHLDRL